MQFVCMQRSKSRLIYRFLNLGVTFMSANVTLVQSIVIRPKREGQVPKTTRCINLSVDTVHQDELQKPVRCVVANEIACHSRERGKSH